jgi:hypothetical protein
MMSFEPSATELLRHELRLDREMWRRQVRQSLLAWSTEALSSQGLKPAAHHRLIIRELEDLAAGRNRRLMLFLPPGSAKSTFASVLFPAWQLARRRHVRILAASNTMSLATDFGRRVADLLREHGPTLGVGMLRETAEQIITTNDGIYIPAGVGSAIAGKRADIGIIDDAVKSREEVESETQREKVWRWYLDDFMTRLKPGAVQVAIGTRWHEDDLFGRILEHQPGLWRVLNIPAMAESDDPLGRKPGEFLWADDDYGYAADLAEKKKTSLPATWASLYQQRPKVEGGAIIKEDDWRPFTDPLKDMRPDFVILSIDTAYTQKNQNDPSACTVWWVTDGDDGRSIALMRYAWAKRLEFPELVDELQETIDHFTVPGVGMRVVIETKAAGLSVIQELRRRMPDVSIWGIDPTQAGDKVARAYSCQPMFQAGRVWHAAHEDGETKGWAASVINECSAFPNGKHDDLTDTVTQALRHMREIGIVTLPEDDPAPASPASVIQGGKRRYGPVGVRR